MSTAESDKIGINVAVIVPVYNRPISVPDTLSSVREQTLPPRRLIIIDDGSTDSTPNAVKCWISSSDRIGLACEVSLILQPNRGVSAARNEGANLAVDCTHLLFLDSDDIIPTDFLARALRAIRDYPSAVAWTADHLCISYPAQSRRYVDLSTLTQHATPWFIWNGGGICSSTIVPKSMFFSLGSFNVLRRTGQDLDLFLKLSCLGLWAHIPGSPVVIRRELTRQRGEETHLSDAFEDRHRLWAEILEDFVRSPFGRTVNPKLTASALTYRWNVAGQHLWRNGNPSESAACYLRSLCWLTRQLELWVKF